MIHKISFSLKDEESRVLINMIEFALEDMERFTPEGDYLDLKEGKMSLRKLYTGLVTALRRSAVKKDMLAGMKYDRDAEQHKEKAGRAAGAAKRKSAKPRPNAKDPSPARKAHGRNGSKAKRKTKKA